MFNSLSGTITNLAVDGTVHLEIGGIEWELRTSLNTLHALPSAGSTVRMFTYLYHREDQMTLFGFSAEEERRVFLDLLKVGGIGPRQALRILSGVSAAALVSIIESGDVDALAALPGLGKKTSQKVILALKGKLQLEDGDASPFAELVEALVGMGFDKQRAGRVVRQVAGELQAEDVDGDERDRRVLKEAIVRLSS
jgi:Holliday junction DNA helicase RuvA